MSFDKAETRALETAITFTVEVTATKVNQNGTLKGLTFKTKAKGVDAFVMVQNSGTYFKVDPKVAGIKIASEKAVPAKAEKVKLF